MFMAGPFNRELIVHLPIGDSQITLGEYLERARRIALDYAQAFGYTYEDPICDYEPENRRIVVTVPVTVYDFFPDEENVWF